MPHIHHRPPRGYEAIVGLHVGETYVAAADVRRLTRGRLRLHSAAVIHCQTRDAPAVVAAAIKRLWREGNFHHYTICATMSDADCLFRRFRFQGLDSAELVRALQLEAESALQREIKDIAMDHHVSAGRDSAAGTIEGFFVAVPREPVDRLLSVLEQAALYPVIVDAPFTALGNAFLATYPHADRTTCLVHIDQHGVTLAIVANNDCLYARSCVTAAAQREDVNAYITENIKEVLDTCHYSGSNSRVERLLITGPVADPDAFARRCTADLHVPTEYWNPVDAIPMRSHLRRQLDRTGGVARLSIALGLALGRRR